MSVTVTESVVVQVVSPARIISVYDSATVTEDISSHVPFYLLSVNDTCSLTESIGRNLICLIKPTSGATFGQTTKQGSPYASNGGRIWGGVFDSGGGGSLQSITAYIKIGASRKVKCAIYSYVPGIPVTIDYIAATEEKTLGVTDDWVIFTFSSPPSLTGSTNYLLCFWLDESHTVYYNSSGGTAIYKNVAYNGWPASIESFSSHQWIHSIYGTYATSGPVESVSVSESIGRKVISFIDVSDAAGVTDVDAVVVRAFFSPSVYDSVGVTDVVTALPLVLPGVEVYDNVALTELITSVASLAGISVSDAVTVTDSLIDIILCLLISESEAITLSESVTGKTNPAGISVSDAITILEGIYLDLWVQRIKENDTDAWTERTKENEEDAWTERIKENDTDAWTERTNKESA